MPDLLPSPTVHAAERITRFCRNSGHMRRDQGRATYRLFMPPSDKKLSVARTLDMSDAQIRQVAAEHVPPPVKGYASVQAELIVHQGLTFDPNGDPYAQHADVIGWSGEEAENRTVAVVLADASSLVDYEAPARA